MSRNIPNHLRLLVADRAGYRCEYCLVPELFLAVIFQVDHIRSLKHGGLTVLLNLCFCCPHCNRKKGSDVATFENETSENLVRLFNPRKDVWNDHFEVRDGEISGKTKIGEATARILEFNLPERVMLRKALILAGNY